MTSRVARNAVCWLARDGCVSRCHNDGTTRSTAAAAKNAAGRIQRPGASAESAAPAAFAHNASIVTVDAKGTMTTVRKGTNGWTCMPDAPDTPGPDPMCFDANAGKWVDAWVDHKPPPAGTPSA